MKFTIYIDQLVLEKWKGKIDLTDCLILSLISGLDAKNPNIKNRMKDDFFLITRKWLLQELPLLQVCEKTITRHLMKLTNLGILLRKHIRNHDGTFRSYYKLSDTYNRISKKRHSKVKRPRTVMSLDQGHLRPRPGTPVSHNELISINSLHERSAGETPSGVSPPIDEYEEVFDSEKWKKLKRR